ncbi:grpE protein homolog, mitochondrial [Tribolium castaneum]|uniref:GrpE protein homolog n=1 Tax=Tribolium castaneum TaxID=7070 RepID=D6WBZ8_TRICA|nr:PREDICTED: grpE protein homolog, mitochondrial [Tribolium castaneum]EEZ99113.1 GrpE protein homolog, mitochondrial-like Protein [Tribolium castaneum]|eukprot:XP_967697.1 PREDICTED: grpE protein homolog, mitochondrial [Tribolium castaneum]
MSLMGIRGLLKYGKIINESVILNTRSITLMNMRMNNAPEGQAKQEQVSQNSTPPPSEQPKVEDIEQLNKNIAELTEKNNELLDKYKRALADGENLRNRLTKQISEAKLFGIQGFCKDLLDVADVLGKATETVPKEEISDKNPHLKSLYEGLVMTEAQLQSVFKRHGLECVNPLNEKFNPNYHEALFQQEVEGKESGTVVVVSKIGYKLHDRVIRPALVGVAK